MTDASTPSVIAAVLADALIKAELAEQLLTEQLAFAVCEKDHPQRHRTGTFTWQVNASKADLAEAQKTTDALRVAIVRMRASA